MSKSVAAAASAGSGLRSFELSSTNLKPKSIGNLFKRAVRPFKDTHAVEIAENSAAYDSR